MTAKRHVKTAVQVKAEFLRQGKSVSAWAREHGFDRVLVHNVLSGKRGTRFGKGHEVAVLLGMKEGVIQEKRGASRRAA